MTQMLLVGRAGGNISDYSSILTEEFGITITSVERGVNALDAIRNQSFCLAIVDEKLPDYTGLEFVEALVQVNPMMLCAVISDQTADQFHESSEGLGVLSQLPSSPTQEDVNSLLQKLGRITDLAV